MGLGSRLLQEASNNLCYSVWGMSTECDNEILILVNQPHLHTKFPMKLYFCCFILAFYPGAEEGGEKKRLVYTVHTCP